jgi:hypothetical protein
LKPSWIDTLHAEGKSKRKLPLKQLPPDPLLVRRVTIQVRKPSGNDPGEIAFGFYTFENSVLQMTDENGSPLAESASVVCDEFDARAIAASLTKERWSKARGGFWRQL